MITSGEDTLVKSLETPNEINLKNYETGLEELLELIKISDFVAFDATVETTGFLLKNEAFNPAYMKDVHNCFGEWYEKIKSREKDSWLMEVGVAVFKRSPENPNEMEAEAFNIPLLPAVVDDNEMTRFRGVPRVNIGMEGYGREFINEVEFDVNKCFYLGAPYLNQKLQEDAMTYMKANPNFMVARRKRPLDPHLMPILYKEVDDKAREIIIKRLRGVSKVIEVISTHKIPVVGHHLLLKLIYMHKDFVSGLPDSYPECMDDIKQTFKIFYDTKQLALDLAGIPKIPSTPMNYEGRLADLKLYELFRNLNFKGDLQKLTVYLSERSVDYMEDAVDISHGVRLEKDVRSYCYVAGFDALISGLAFLDLVTIAELCKVDCWSEEETPCTDYLTIFLKGYPKRFMNRIFGEPDMPMKSMRSNSFLKLMEEKKIQRLQKEKAKEAGSEKVERF